MDPIMEIAKKHNLYVIEDCCQAVGAAYHGKRVGTIGDMGAYSLNVFKTITTGDGGFVGTSSDELYERAFGSTIRAISPAGWASRSATARWSA